MIDNGSATANQLRTFLEENQVDLGAADQQPGHHRRGRRSSTSTGIRQILVLYPYVVEGGFTRWSQGARTGCTTPTSAWSCSNDPPVCHQGYESTDTCGRPRTAANRPMNDERPLRRARLEVQRPRRPERARRPPASYRAPVVATYDRDPGKVTWTDQDPAASVSYTGGAVDSFGRGVLEVVAAPARGGSRSEPLSPTPDDGIESDLDHHESSAPSDPASAS